MQIFVSSILVHTTLLMYWLHVISHLHKYSHRSQNHLLYLETSASSVTVSTYWSKYLRKSFYIYCIFCCECVGPFGHIFATQAVGLFRICFENMWIQLITADKTILGLYWIGPCIIQTFFNLRCRNLTLEKEIFPAATDSRFIRAVSINSFQLTFYSLIELPLSFSCVLGKRFVC